MKNKKGLTVSIIILFMLSFLVLKFVYAIKHPFMVETGKVPVSIVKGNSLYTIIDKLSKKGLIKNKYLIKVYVNGKKLNTNIKPGEYLIDADVSIKKFIQILNEGNESKNCIRITIPEGYNIEDISEIMEKKGIMKKQEFLKSCEKYPTPEFIKVSSNIRYSLEGYLFPDTYEFEKGDTGEEIIKKMLNRFEEVLNDITEKENKEISNIQELITIASVIEKEARTDSDRNKISSVFYNRLDKGMRLQVDATVLYAMGKHKGKLSLKDLEIDSPYNTYKVKGLPPGPISNPGKSCIEAALNPDNNEYIYYVLSDHKKHYFTNNYKDFLKAKERYKKSN
ncbi:endolytic transglycosylase MltG [Clostridium aestuarii]|uniref:Endolytic murein transglycosylase n=1 Tax=Clostridium aestuarii TaxID=338193 RepID=A0ABT4CYH9_9CLOT|nr:endolytic transglycosylase MltG [Clostridium aestuarii]MCY6484039.1 endolytic transglycosylase MltG [Clostridium aestuarii]